MIHVIQETDDLAGLVSEHLCVARLCGLPPGATAQEVCERVRTMSQELKDMTEEVAHLEQATVRMASRYAETRDRLAKESTRSDMLRDLLFEAIEAAGVNPDSPHSVSEFLRAAHHMKTNRGSVERVVQRARNLASDVRETATWAAALFGIPAWRS